MGPPLRAQRGYGVSKCGERRTSSWPASVSHEKVCNKVGYDKKAAKKAKKVVVKEPTPEPESDSEDDSEPELEVEEITIDGKDYYLDSNTGDIYDMETQEVVGKSEDGEHELF